VVVTKLDRLARSLRHLLELVAELEEHRVALVVLDQSGIDTSTSTGRLVLAVLGAVAEFERALILERVRAGVEAARRQGRHPGRRRTMKPEQLTRARRLRRSGKTYRYISGLLGVPLACLQHRELRPGAPPG